MKADEKIFSGAVLVVAHPDDEVLWFSSLVERVEEVVICYLGRPARPICETGREKALREHPARAKITSLGLDEADVLYGADWKKPQTDRFGLKIPYKKENAIKYEENFHRLTAMLRDKIGVHQNVFTHNPWGEYGHEEHVQVYRAIKGLQAELGFDLWFSNCCSNKSFHLAARYLDGFPSRYVTLEADRALAGKIKEVYTRNLCWTWYDPWEWFEAESFIMDQDGVKSGPYGRLWPLNIMKVDHPVSGPGFIGRRLVSKLRKIKKSVSRGKILIRKGLSLMMPGGCNFRRTEKNVHGTDLREPL